MITILLNNNNLDVSENISLPITFSVADIKNPDKREGTYSKTIALPGTKTNNRIFSHIFKVSKLSVSGDFNPNLKAACEIYEDSILILKGSLRLADISYLENGEIVYNCVVFGETSDLFFSISNKKLTDLDLSAYNHNWTRTNIINSWTATKGQGYVYPMIDYGTNQDTFQNSWAVTDFFPAFYAKQYIDKIFSEAGYTYTSSFFTSDFFKSLIVPYNKNELKLKKEDVALRSCYVSNNSNVTKSSTIRNFDISYKKAVAQESYQFWDYLREIEDAGNNFLVDGFTAPYNGLYDIDCLFDLNGYAITAYPSGTSAYNDIYITLGITLWNVSTSTKLINNYKCYELSNNGATVTRTPLNTRIYLNAGETIKIELLTYQLWQFTTAISPTTSTGSSILVIDDSSYLRVKAVDNMSENSLLPASSLIPENIFCKDFLGSIIKMFNLYIEPDKANAKNLIIKTRDSFYSDETGIFDWTDKVNRDVPFKITPLGELDFKNLILRYKEDGDLLNKRYKNSWLEPFGTKNLVVENDFVTNEKVIEPIFSATPSFRGVESNQRVIPKIVSDTSARTASNIRIISYYGTKSTTSWKFTSTLTSFSGQTVYPFAGMVDDADNPTFDLSFDTPKEIYWTMNQANYTNNNLYNAYYSKMFSEIVDQDSKLVECEVLLTAKDINEINFAKKIFIDDTYYILNKIVDADRINTNLTKVELLKLKYGTPFVASSGVLNNFNTINVGSTRVDGGANIVGSSLNGTPAIIEGGKNEVRNIGATSEIMIIEGGNN